MTPDLEQKIKSAIDAGSTVVIQYADLIWPPGPGLDCGAVLRINDAWAPISGKIWSSAGLSAEDFLARLENFRSALSLLNVPFSDYQPVVEYSFEQMSELTLEPVDDQPVEVEIKVGIKSEVADGPV